MNIRCLSLLALCAIAAAKQPVMVYIHHPPESAHDVRYRYQWEILQTALDKTRPKWGDYKLGVSEPMTERRQTLELKNATGKLTVMYLSTTPEMERTLIPVRIPVDKNLGGYCVFLIRGGDQPRFDEVRTLDDLRRFTYGLGLGWIDVAIFKANHFKVVTGSSYDGLFEMLANRRFDAFPRGAVEVLDELEPRQGKLPALRIERSLVFYYPMPMYFWFPKTAEGQRLAARAEDGMRMMISDGTYDRIFDRYQRWKIERLQLAKRRIFRIENPFLGPETPFHDKRLWFDPQTYQ